MTFAMFSWILVWPRMKTPAPRKGVSLLTVYQARFGSKTTLQHIVFWSTFRDLGAKPRHFTNFNSNFTIPRGIQHKTRTFQIMRRVNSPTTPTTTISPVLHYRYYTYLKDIGPHGFLIVHFAKHTTKMTWHDFQVLSPSQKHFPLESKIPETSLDPPPREDLPSTWSSHGVFYIQHFRGDHFQSP